MSIKTLELTLEKITTPEIVTSTSVQQQQRQRTISRGAMLGQLDELSTKLVEITGSSSPKIYPNSTIVCVADHGIITEGVTKDTPESTAQSIQNLLQNKTQTAALVHKLETKLRVLNIGASVALSEHPGIVGARIRSGTRNFAIEPAMSRDDVFASITAGIRMAQNEIQNGSRILLVANIGAGNTTASAAIASVLTGLEVPEVTGAGSGIGINRWRHKCKVIEEALLMHAPSPLDGVDILSKIGGLEMGAIVGIILEATAARIPVVLDSITPVAAGAVATLFEPATHKVLIAAHRSNDPGHGALLDFLDLKSIFDLDIQCRDGAGALLALPILESALATNI